MGGRNMKKFSYILLTGLALAMSAVSCRDVVDIPASDRLTQDVIWSGDQAVLDQYVIGLYGALREKSTLMMMSNQFTDCLTDIMKDGDWIQARRYNRINVGFQQFTSNDALILSNWDDSYSRIRRFNEFFRDAETYADAYNADFLKTRLAEIRLLRAMQYFYIMRVYGNANDSEAAPGGMILRDKLEGPAGNDKQRQRYAESWEWIISQMKLAAEDLPAVWGESNFSRLTKGCAWGFICRAALYAERWDDVIDAANKNNPMAYTICPTAELADSYEMADGTAFSWDKYKANPAAWGNDPFSGREPRFYTTILYNNEDWEGRKIEAYEGGTDGIQIFKEEGGRTSTCTGYYFRKFITEDDHSWDEKGSNHFDIYIRYAEVLLNKAEALARKDWGANKTAALAALNETRGRVGLPARSAATLDGFMDLLEQERKVELAGENFRFWDLRRWGKGIDRLNGKSFHGVLIKKDDAAPGGFRYEICDIDAGKTRIFMERYAAFSLPLAELNNNKALNNTNNPGW